MDTLMNITLISVATGIVGTGLGGLFASAFHVKKNDILGFIMQLSAGLMLAVVAFDLLPAAFDTAKMWNQRWFLSASIVGVIAGVMFAAVIQHIMERGQEPQYRSKKVNLMQTGIITGIAIAMHNTFEGLAIGSGFDVSPVLGISIAIAIFFHDIPEGTAMAAPMIGAGMSVGKATFYAALSGVPMALGAALGVILGTISPLVIAICLAAAAGTMLYISFCDLIPTAGAISPASYAGAVLGMMLGIIVTNIFD
ncbi:MAG: ZIP family metal transporter [Bacillota bacterium]|nr:ZIP family metal transporter [Bacillota bacterium]